MYWQNLVGGRWSISSPTSSANDGYRHSFATSICIVRAVSLLKAMKLLGIRTSGERVFKTGPEGDVVSSTGCVGEGVSSTECVGKGVSSTKCVGKGVASHEHKMQ